MRGEGKGILGAIPYEVQNQTQSPPDYYSFHYADTMAAELADLHTVLTNIGMVNVADRNTLVDVEGFASIADLGILDGDNDINEMAKRLASRPAAAGRVIIGTVLIKRLQGLVWWVRDRQKRDLPLDPAEFDDAAMRQAIEMRQVRKELRDKTEPEVKELGTFNPDYFESYEDAFINFLARTTGVQGEPLRYVVRDDTPPAEFANDEQRRMYQLALDGRAFELDNTIVFQKLKAFLLDTPGWAWIESFDASENGRAAFMAWRDHYNGQGQLSKRTQLAKAKLKNLYYKNERSMSFERYSEELSKIYQTLDKDVDERLSDRQKVEHLLAGIRTEDAELRAAKTVIRSQHPNNFTDACAFFSSEVARLHGVAQLEGMERRGKRKISALDTSGRGGRGRGRFGGRGGRGGRGRGGRGGGGGGGNRTEINGVDVSNPTRDFSTEEWNALGADGWRYVQSARDRINGAKTGRGGDRGRGRGGGGGDRSIGAVAKDKHDTDSGEQDSGSGERGSKNGRNFGRGAYSGRKE